MRNIVVLTREPGFFAALRSVLSPADYRLIHQHNVEEAEPLLDGGSIDGCILEADLVSVEPIRIIEKLRRKTSTPLLIFAAHKQWEWEERAYLLGTSHILEKPIRASLVNSILQRVFAAPHPAAAPAPPALSKAKVSETSRPATELLEVLRDFSGILKHSLQSRELLNQFLRLLREIIGVNRAAIFLRKIAPGAVPTSLGTSTTLTASCAIGLAPGLLEHFELSLTAGIGGFLYRYGRILKCDGLEAEADREIQKEFELLGAQVAIPILDRESLIGVAVFDRPLTGDPFSKEELALIFHLLEELGLAIRNSWLHDQLSANHEMMSDILGQLESACVVISSDLSILHANTTARSFFGRAGQAAVALEFSDLPQPLGSKVFNSLKTGLGLPPFKYRFSGNEKRVFQVTITPFKRQQSHSVNAVLLLLENFTQHERAQQLEIEAANLRLIKNMAERLAHEIGNAIMPLSVHGELLPERFEDTEFRNSLGEAMDEGVHRISRLARQMFFLARDSFERADVIEIGALLQQGFDEAQNYYAGKKGKLKVEGELPACALKVDLSAMRHALAEVMLNALQANPLDPLVTVSAALRPDAAGGNLMSLEVYDTGVGFSRESASLALNPFYSTRTVGIGLGLSVARKIIERHSGRIELTAAEKNHRDPVRITLPVE